VRVTLGARGVAVFLILTAAVLFHPNPVYACDPFNTASCSSVDTFSGLYQGPGSAPVHACSTAGTASVPWITGVSVSSGFVTFNIASQNLGDLGRWGLITLQCDQILILQCAHGGQCSFQPPSLTLSLQAGDRQTGVVLERVSQPLVVHVTDQSGDNVNGMDISFSVSEEPAANQTRATLSVTSTTTQNGLASTELTFGDTFGRYQVTATCVGSQTCAPGSVTFTANAADCEHPLVGQASVISPFHGVDPNHSGAVNYDGDVFHVEIIPSRCSNIGGVPGQDNLVEVLTPQTGGANACPNMSSLFGHGHVLPNDGTFRWYYEDTVAVRERLTQSSCVATFSQQLFWLDQVRHVPVAILPEPNTVTFVITLDSSTSSITVSSLGLTTRPTYYIH
jgi:hypothetical protein